MSEREDAIEVLRYVIAADPYHQQFTPLVEAYDDLRQCLTTAERERDEARRERDDHKAMYLDLWDAAKRHESERDQFASMLHDCENERDGYKHRAERMERVVDLMRGIPVTTAQGET